MDKLKDMAGDASGLQDTLKGIDFPIDKNQLISQLEQKGVPSQVTDKLRNVNTEQFDSRDEVLSKIKGLF